MHELHSVLIQLGYSEKESVVYLAALELGAASASEIARRAGVNRATTYSVLEVLMKKLLITSIEIDNEKRFVAESPEQIERHLIDEERELALRKKLAQEKMPTIMRLHSKLGAQPKIRYIEGIEGLRKMQREYEGYEEDIIQIVGYDFFLQMREEVVEGHREKLIKSKRKIRSIFVTDNDIQFPKELSIEYVTISPSLVDVRGEMTVCGDRLVLFSYTNGVMAVEILSATLAQMVRETLELAWREVKQWQKEGSRP